VSTAAVTAEEVAAAVPLFVLEANDVVVVVASKGHLEVLEVDAVTFACVHPCFFDLANYA